MNQTFVIDASALAEALLTESGEAVREMLAGSHLVAPQLIVPEFLSVLRGWLRSGLVTATRAQGALEDFRALGVELFDMLPLADEAWNLRNNASTYDAMYVALARVSETRLLTTDRRLDRGFPDDCLVPGDVQR